MPFLTHELAISTSRLSIPAAEGGASGRQVINTDGDSLRVLMDEAVNWIAFDHTL